jgi:hypothetical protein
MDDKKKAAIGETARHSQQNQKHDDYSADPLRMWFALGANVMRQKRKAWKGGRHVY